MPSTTHTRRWPGRGAVLLAGSMVFLLLLPVLLNSLLQATGLRLDTLFPRRSGALAPLFTPTINYWSADIERWSAQYSLDPNLLATIMQIESCGHPTVISSAGAQGLFQVMPFHFEAGESSLDPNTNALRSARFVQFCLDYSGDDLGLTLACYNGGPSVVKRNFHTWAKETQRYYLWAVGIYSDALKGAASSSTLDAWLQAGGARLCDQAARALGL